MSREIVCVCGRRLAVPEPRLSDQLICRQCGRLISAITGEAELESIDDREVIVADKWGQIQLVNGPPRFEKVHLLRPLVWAVVITVPCFALAILGPALHAPFIAFRLASLAAVGVAIPLAIIYWMNWYRVWKHAIAWSREVGVKAGIRSAGLAVGPMFVPLFNLYWQFRVFHVGRTINRVIAGGGLKAPRSPTLFATVLCVIMVLCYILPLAMLGCVDEAGDDVWQVKAAAKEPLASQYGRSWAVAEYSKSEILAMIWIAAGALATGMHLVFLADLGRSVNEVGLELQHRPSKSSKPRQGAGATVSGD